VPRGGSRGCASTLVPMLSRLIFRADKPHDAGAKPRCYRPRRFFLGTRAGKRTRNEGGGRSIAVAIPSR